MAPTIPHDPFAERVNRTRLLRKLSQQTMSQTSESIRAARERLNCSSRTLQAAKMLLREKHNGQNDPEERRD